MREHWADYGRNYYARHDYEEVDGAGANALIAGAARRPSHASRASIWRAEVAAADDFAYHDPVDGSDSAQSGHSHPCSTDGSRIVYRLSGTGTAGATLRVYIERFEPDPARQQMDTSAALADLIALSNDIAGIKRFTGRVAPSVIT